MSYNKTDWTNNSTPAINADNLNKIEQGIYDNDAAIASANTNIGTLTNLTTTEKSNLVGAINEVDSNTDINATNIGDLSDLETTAQTDIVSAINENVDNIGDLTTLTTTANTDLVSAVNELDDLKATKDVATTSANGLMSASDKSKLNSINDSVSIVQGVTSNIGSAYWANQINYIVLGKVAFCYVIINLRTKNQATLDEEAYVQMPFTFKNNWYFPAMKANYSTTQDIFMQGASGTNRLYLTKNSNRDRYKVSELPNAGYIVDVQFFALLE